MTSRLANVADMDGVGVVVPGTPPPPGIERLLVLLIKPSKYDDDGYVLRYFRGVLPSNTLATLAGLSDEVARSGALGAVQIDTVMMDEHVQKIDARRLARQHGRPGTRIVVALCGVQTNQFPRAADLALDFRDQDLPVMIGGFHVSGSIGMSSTGMPPDCQELLDAGVTLVKGEVEGCWGDLLRDALHGSLKPFYDIAVPPDIRHATVPMVDPRLMKRFAYPYLGTIDAGRGCPFHCSFCTIINVQGRKMRTRSAEGIIERIRANAAHKIAYYFFTDDNFARNPLWEEILDGIIRLRREEGIRIQFMMQVDTLASRLKGFVEKASDAGCTQVFIGMETLNPLNLPSAGKPQNRVGDYKGMIDTWHGKGIACHVGYIIGFPFDTVESVREDVRRLREEIGVDQASFFMLTPIPGSADHRDMTVRGDWMDGDYNRFDSFHATIRHPRMSAEQWSGIFQEAWERFYAVDAMKAILAKAPREGYWGLFKNFLWYRHSAIVERTHPMICGFFRMKDRHQRRRGMALEPFFRYRLRRIREVARWSREAARLYFQMQEVWLATRGRAQLRENLDDLKSRYADVRHRLGASAHRAGEAFSRQVAGVRAGAGEVLERAGKAGLRTVLSSRLNPFSLRIRTRAALNNYWAKTRDQVLRGRVFRINPFLLTVNLFRDAKACAFFSVALLIGQGK